MKNAHDDRCCMSRKAPQPSCTCTAAVHCAWPAQAVLQRPCAEDNFIPSAQCLSSIWCQLALVAVKRRLHDTLKNPLRPAGICQALRTAGVALQRLSNKWRASTRCLTSTLESRGCKGMQGPQSEWHVASCAQAVQADISSHVSASALNMDLSGALLTSSRLNPSQQHTAGLSHTCQTYTSGTQSAQCVMCGDCRPDMPAEQVFDT